MSRIWIINWLVILAVFGLLIAPAPALQAQSVHIEKSCPLMSGCCKGSMMMKCSGKCPIANASQKSQGSTCQVSLFSSIEASDPGYSYSGKGSSNTYGTESLPTNSSSAVSQSAYPSYSKINYNGIGPPDLDVLAYLPPSAQLVFDILASQGPMTQKDIISRTEMPTSTVRYALSKLKEESLIRKSFYIQDGRQSLYGLNTVAPKAERA